MAFHAESIVRPFVVELVDEVVEARLLLQAVHAGRASGLLAGEVQALVTAILLGLSRFDALDADAEAEPPNRQLGERRGRWGWRRARRCQSEWHAANRAAAFTRNGAERLGTVPRLAHRAIHTPA
jgi:hypothetical protein